MSKQPQLWALAHDSAEVLGEVDPQDPTKFLDGTPVPSNAEVMMKLPRSPQFTTLPQLPTTYSVEDRRKQADAVCNNW